jgi:hypothetical protein
MAHIFRPYIFFYRFLNHFILFAIIGEKNHQNFDDRQAHFNPTQQMHYDNGAGQYCLLVFGVLFSLLNIFQFDL